MLKNTPAVVNEIVCSRPRPRTEVLIDTNGRALGAKTRLSRVYAVYTYYTIKYVGHRNDRNYRGSS